ncbi:FHA domain-containing protein [Streptomyces zhihengii]
MLALQTPAGEEPHDADVPAELHVVAGPDAGGVHLLHGGRISVGRSADADVPLDDPDVSRLHCEVTVSEDGRVTVADLDSTNGTTVDGAPVGTRPVRLPAGALLRVGESALRLAAAPPPRAPPPPRTARATSAYRSHPATRSPPRAGAPVGWAPAGFVPRAGGLPRGRRTRWGCPGVPRRGDLGRDGLRPGCVPGDAGSQRPPSGERTFPGSAASGGAASGRGSVPGRAGSPTAGSPGGAAYPGGAASGGPASSGSPASGAAGSAGAGHGRTAAAQGTDGHGHRDPSGRTAAGQGGARTSGSDGGTAPWPHARTGSAEHEQAPGRRATAVPRSTGHRLPRRGRPRAGRPGDGRGAAPWPHPHDAGTPAPPRGRRLPVRATAPRARPAGARAVRARSRRHPRPPHRPAARRPRERGTRAADDAPAEPPAADAPRRRGIGAWARRLTGGRDTGAAQARRRPLPGRRTPARAARAGPTRPPSC